MTGLMRHFIPIATEIGKSRCEPYSEDNTMYSIITSEKVLVFRDEYGGRFLLGSARKLRQIVYCALGFGLFVGYVLGRIAS